MTTRSPRGRIGSTIRDKYRVETFIATGSMANVYAATHRNGGRVALKILHRELASDPNMRERFKREGYFCNAIDHPAIAKAIDDDITDDDCPFIVMDLLEGENLEVRRKRLGGRLPLAEVLTVADGVLDVLATAHERNILHRDLKPENVFLTHEGVVKLLDFGVARFNDGKTSSDVTGVGMVLGSPAFMPPEQALGLREEVDARSDLWSLGATLFTMLSGESVHTGDTAKAKLVATATKPARKLREVLPNLPSAVTAVIDRALEYHRSERWDDANAMREALRWARMSLDPEAEVMTSSSPNLAAAAPTAATRRVRAVSMKDDEVTIMRRPTPEEEVYTSAPPITARSTIPDDRPPSFSDTGESMTFSLRNDPIFSLRRPADRSDPADEPTPNTQRLPGQDNDLGLPVLRDAAPLSEDVRMEYTRPMMAMPAGFRGTLPLAHTPGTGSGSVPAVVPAPPPSNPQLAPGPTSRPSGASGPHAALVQQIAPPSSGTGTKVFLALLLAGMLVGTVAFLYLRRTAAEPRPTPTSTAAQTSAPIPSAAPTESTTPSPSAEPAPIASEAPSASAAPEPVVSAPPKPKPRPKPVATASASATSTAATPEETATAAPIPIPLPLPVPGPSPTTDPAP